MNGCPVIDSWDAVYALAYKLSGSVFLASYKATQYGHLPKDLALAEVRRDWVRLLSLNKEE